jgi:PAS domain S-box-containing protein
MAAKQDRLTKAADILVVDDSTATLRMLTEILTKVGYKIRPVEEPRMALEAALAQPPDLILLDVKMPKMSGFEVCRRLKQDERTRDVPVIFVSALDELQDRIQGFEVGGVDFISKPVQELEVLARVKTHLQLRNTQLHLEYLVARRTTELEKLLAERSLALSYAEAQIRSLFEYSPLGTALSSFEGKILQVNEAMVQMMRVTEAELKQTNVTEFYFEPRERETMLERLRETGAVQDFGVQIVRNDGSTFYASMNVSLIVVEGDNVLLAMIQDVTNQLLAEQAVAVTRERERLARELHDAVTQTLFSASVIAEATPKIWDEDEAMGRRYLEQLPIMLRGSLAEMRMLLLELRPSAIGEQTLGQLLESLVEATRSYSRAEVTLKVEGDRNFPDDITMGFLRIVQEGLNNVIKHAEASLVEIWLSSDPEGAEIHITDDGHGFDPESIPAGSMGINIMRDRARNMGAMIKIDSQHGKGSRVVITWKNSDTPENEK